MLEQLGYEVKGANEVCWVMMRHGCLPLQIQRLGPKVEINALYSTLNKARISPEQFFKMCQLLTAPEPKPDDN